MEFKKRSFSSHFLSSLTTETNRKQNIENFGECLKDVYKKLDKHIQQETTAVETGRGVADSFKEFGLRQVATAPILGKLFAKLSICSVNFLPFLNLKTNQISLFSCFFKFEKMKAVALKNLGSLSRNLEDIRSDLLLQQSKIIVNPFKATVKDELKEIVDLEKRFDKSHVAYDSALSKVKQLSEKSKVSITKVEEVRMSIVKIFFTTKSSTKKKRPNKKKIILTRFTRLQKRNPSKQFKILKRNWRLKQWHGSSDTWNVNDLQKNFGK